MTVTANQPLPWMAQQWQRFLRHKQQGDMPHALLITGQKGIGKHQLATWLAQLILCENKEGTCYQCQHCHWYQQDNHPDFYRITLVDNKKSIGIQQIRALIDKLQQTTLQGNYQTVIIEAAEKMTMGAANALLKTLEEPSGRVVIILVSDQPHRLPATIISRCQQCRIAIPPHDQAIKWLSEQPSDDANLSERLAIHDGAPLAALNSTVLTQYQAYYDDWLALSQHQTDPVQLAAKWVGLDPLLSIEFLQHLMLDGLRYLSGMQPAYFQQAKSWETLWLAKNRRSTCDYFSLLIESRRKIDSAHNPNPQLLLENLMIQWAIPSASPQR